MTQTNLCTKQKQSQTQRADLWLRDGKDALGMWHSVQLLSPVWLFGTPWTAARQASLYITNSRSLLKLMSTEEVMPFGINRCKLLHIEWINKGPSYSVAQGTIFNILLNGLIPLNGKEYLYMQICIYVNTYTNQCCICEYTTKWKWWNSSWAISNLKRWCHESAALNIYIVNHCKSIKL